MIWKSSRWKEMSKGIISFLFLFSTITACGTSTMDKSAQSDETVTVAQEAVSQVGMEENTEQETAANELPVPSKEEVFAMRDSVLEGMSEEETARLKENIKVANLQMEKAYMYENLFDKLSDPDSLYWQYFDNAGDIQIGWWYNNAIYDMAIIMKNEKLTEEEFYARQYEPGIVYNRFDADNFVTLIQDMQESVQDDRLIADLQQLIDLTESAAETHDVQYAVNIYKILHDMDYFLLRYGPEDIGKYTQDAGMLAKYYGVLCVYGATPSDRLNDGE